MQIRSPETVRRLTESATKQQRQAEDARAAAQGYAEEITQLTAALDQAKASYAAARDAANEAADLAHDYTECARAACEANDWPMPAPDAPTPPAAPAAPRTVEQQARAAVDQRRTNGGDGEQTQAMPQPAEGGAR